MATGPQDRITAFWSTVAPGYEAHPGNVVAPGTPEHDVWVERVRTFLPEAPVDVLDVGTGTGFLALIIASLGHRVTGIDLSREMLEEARANAVVRGLDVEFVPGDAVDPPFPPAAFDVVTNRHLLWTLREPDVAFRNWHTVLRPGGRVVAVDGCHFDATPPEEDATGPFEEHYTLEARAALPFMHIDGIAPVVAMLGGAGFDRVSTSEHAELADPTTPAVVPYVLVAHRSPSTETPPAN